MAHYTYDMERIDGELEICAMTKQQLALLFCDGINTTPPSTAS